MPCSPPMRVQRFEQLERLHALAVHRNRHAFLEADGHLARLVRAPGRGSWSASRFRPARRWPDLPARRLRARCARCCGRGCRSWWWIAEMGTLCFARVFDGVLARDDVPFAPRRDHRQMRRQRLVGQLETHLVVALAGAAVGQRVAAGGQRHFHLFLGQQRPRDGGAQQILVLVDAAGRAPASTGTGRRTPRACPRRGLRTRRSCGALASRPVSSSPPWPISPHTATTSQP